MICIAITVLGTLVDGDETKVNGVSVGLADKWVVVPQETALVQAAREPLMCRLKPRQKLMVLAFVDVKGILINC
jgi:hypothetical protein